MANMVFIVCQAQKNPSKIKDLLGFKIFNIVDNLKVIRF